MALTIGGQIRKEVINLIPETATNTNITMIKVKDVKVVDRIRDINSDKVEYLARSIKIGTLLQPIIVRNDYTLVAGYHRLEAYKLLKLKDIPCIIKDIDETQAKLLEIDENLIRNELSELELGEALIEKQNILEELHMRGKAGYEQYIKDRANFAFSRNIIKEIADNIGLSRRSVQLKTQIARNLTPRVRDYIRDTEIADNQSALEEISRVNKDEQMKVAEKAHKYLEEFGITKGIAKAVKELTTIKEDNKKNNKEDDDFSEQEDIYPFIHDTDIPKNTVDVVCIEIPRSWYNIAERHATALNLTVPQYVVRLIEESDEP